jgi:hypothetical protein
MDWSAKALITDVAPTEPTVTVELNTPPFVTFNRKCTFKHLLERKTQ